MTDSQLGALGLSRIVLRVLIVLNLFSGACILTLLIATFVVPELMLHFVGATNAEESVGVLGRLRVIVVAGLVGIGLNDRVLTRLLAIVDTVRAGHPFVVENARRLQLIAWYVAGIQIAHLIVGAAAASAGPSGQPLDIDWKFSFTPWMAVLLLFVLARVFDHGARMREELEGTV